MPVAHGHGNPKWTREEIILALDLYFDCKGKVPSASDSRVKELSETLKAFPYHSLTSRKESFRNADGVAFKLQNLRQIETGQGLSNVSVNDKAVWEEFGSDPTRTKAVANLIRTGVEIIHEIRQSLPEYEVFVEGRVVTETHLRRERHPELRKKLIENRKAKGELRCEVCSIYATSSDPQLAEAIFEAHHVIPLSEGQQRSTKLSDMALVCACCHRQIHKAIALNGRWLSIKEAKSLIIGK